MSDSTISFYENKEESVDIQEGEYARTQQILRDGGGGHVDFLGKLDPGERWMILANPPILKDSVRLCCKDIVAELAV